MQSKPEVLLSNWVHDGVVEYLSAHATVIANERRAHAPSTEELVALGRGAHALMAFMPDCVDGAMLRQMPNLRIVACALKGFDNFDVEACTEAGVWVSIVPDLLTVPTAELAVGLMIGVGRHIRHGHEHIASGRFDGWRAQLYGNGIAGNTVGIVGMGAVGQAIAQRLSGFDAKLQYFDAAETAPGYARRDLDELLASSDYVVLALPLNPSTTRLIDARAISLMRPAAILVNPARGSLVDEQAVADALESGRLAGYAADVFECEDWARTDRPREVHPALRNAAAPTLLTPHLGSAVDSVRREIAMQAARNIVAVLGGSEPPDAVNRPRRHGA